MEAKVGCFCNTFEVVHLGRKLHENLTLARFLLPLVVLLSMAITTSAAPPPPPAEGCPLDMNIDELQFLCKNLPLPPPGVSFGSSNQKPPTCCQLSMNFWLAKQINATGYQTFYLTPAAAKNCTDTFNMQFLPQLPSATTCQPLNTSLLLANFKDPCQNFNKASDLPKTVADTTWAPRETICRGNLSNPGTCGACGQGIIDIVTEMANGFPLPGCVTSTTIVMGSRVAAADHWLNLSTCVGTAVYAGSFQPGGSGPPGFAGPPVGAPAPAPSPVPVADDGRTTSDIPTIVGIVLGASILAVFFAVCVYAVLIRKRAAKRPSDLYLKNGDDESSPPSRLLLSGHLEHTRLQPFLFSELQAATSNFSEVNRVGTGGSADVYKGVLPNGHTVAIKKLLKVSVAEREFLNEIAVVASLKHRNLATLIGYSESNLGFLLVFDFYPNGSMEDALFHKDYPKRLTWGQCIDVVIGAAKGIAHLHGVNTIKARTNQQKVIHRDIKPSNILLDGNFQACVADFGVSRNLQMAQTHVTTKIMGTFGYVAPEYASTGKLTEKSDVYSFGVLMLVVLSKKQPAGPDMAKLGSESLVEYAFSLARQEQMLLMISTDYEGQFTVDEAERILSVALLCVQPTPQQRPTFDKVVLMLEGRDDVPPVPIPAARAASSMLPGLKRLIFGGEDAGLTGMSSLSTTTLESLDSTQTFAGDPKHTGSSAVSSEAAHEPPHRGDRELLSGVTEV